MVRKRKKKRGQIQKLGALFLAVAFFAFSINSSLSKALYSDNDSLPVIQVDDAGSADLSNQQLPVEDVDTNPEQPVGGDIPEVSNPSNEDAVDEGFDRASVNEQEVSNEESIDNPDYIYSVSDISESSEAEDEECDEELLGTVVAQGTVGTAADAAQWTLYENGTVRVGAGTLRGTGTITGSISPWHTHRNQVLRIEFTEPTVGVSHLTGLFRDLHNVREITGLEMLDVSGVTAMTYMFRNTHSLVSIGDVSGWDTSNVTSMAYMFRNAENLTSLNVSNWNTGNVNNMHGLFHGASSLTQLDVSNWNVSRVTNMASMFSRMDGITSLNLSNWNPVSAVNFSGMFHNSANIVSIGDVSNWNTGNVTNMRSLFHGARSLVSVDVGNWNVSNVTTMYSMFGGTRSLASVGDISGWNTGNVTTMFNMFSGNPMNELNLSTWNVGNVQNMQDMFYNMHNLTNVGDISGWNTGSVITMRGMFWNASSLNGLDLSSWDVGRVINMSNMFLGARSITNLGDISNWNTVNVTNMGLMFRDARGLTELDLSGWNTGNVTNMADMFRDTRSLRILNLRDWNTGNVSNMNQMFLNANALRQITLGEGWQASGCNHGLLDVWTTEPFTGRWQNVAIGTPENPLGEMGYPSNQLLDDFDPDRMADTWVWEVFIPQSTIYDIWRIPLQRRDWIVTNPHHLNDNHEIARPAFPIFGDGEGLFATRLHPDSGTPTATLGELFNQFFENEMRRTDGNSSGNEAYRGTRFPENEADRRIAFRVWHGTPNQRFHIDIVADSDELFPYTRWGQNHFQYAYVQYLHFNQNFCGNGVSSDVNPDWQRMNIMGSYYDRMFVYRNNPAVNDLWEGSDMRYETLGNRLFPTSPYCPEHPYLSGMEPVSRNVVHPQGYIFGGWFDTLAQANNLNSQEGRVSEREMGRVTTDLNRTIYARWYPVVEELGSITVIVEDEDGNLVPGAEVRLYDEENNLIGSGATDEDGAVVFENLPDGLYEVVVTHPNFPNWEERREVEVVDASDEVVTVFVPEKSYVPCDCGECDDCYEPYIPCDCGACEDCYEPYIPCDCGECEDCYEPYIPCDCGECEYCYEPYVPCTCNCDECDECDSCKGNCDCRNYCSTGIGGGGSGNNNPPNTPAGNQNPPRTPQTGDNTNILHYFIPAIMSFMVLVIISRKKLRERKQ